MSSNLRRNKNRKTADRLAGLCEVCPECGGRGRHYIVAPGFSGFLAPIAKGMDVSGFWTCAKFYGPDGRRIGA